MAPTEPRDADVDEINSKLSEGLATCRTVVKDYRIALAGTQASASGASTMPDEAAETLEREVR